MPAVAATPHDQREARLAELAVRVISMTYRDHAREAAARYGLHPQSGLACELAHQSRHGESWVFKGLLRLRKQAMARAAERRAA